MLPLIAFLYLLISFADASVNPNVLESTSIDANLPPTIANGILGSPIGSGQLHLAGLYNGRTQHSHLANLPLPIDFQPIPPWGWHLQEETYRLRLDVGTFEHEYIYQYQSSQVRLIKSMAAHRTLPNALVVELTIESSTREYFHIVYNATWPNWRQLHSDDVQFGETRRDYKYFQDLCLASGSTTEAELPPWTTTQNVSLLWTALPYSSWLWSGEPTLLILTLASEAEEAYAEMFRALEADRYLLALHQEAWRRQWLEARLEVSDPVLQRDCNAALYYLTGEVAPDTHVGGIPSDGLSGSGGRIAWHQELWMMPALQALYPKLSAAVLRGRVKALPSAKSNARRFGFVGARYPWEAARSGVEVASAPFGELSVHVTCAVSWALISEMSSNGREATEKEAEMAFEIARYWESRLRVGRDGVAHVESVCPPDQYHRPVNDSVYTNACARIALALPAAMCTNSRPPAFCTNNSSAIHRWHSLAQHLLIVETTCNNSLCHAEFSGYSFHERVRQADAILLGYPLQVSTQTRRTDLDAYLPLTDRQGPALSDSMFAIGYLEFGDGKAKADELIASFLERYVQGDFRICTEFPRVAESVGRKHYMAGYGGLIQALVNGYAGVRYLPQCMRLHVKPTLASLTIRGLYFRGERFRVESVSAGQWRFQWMDSGHGNGTAVRICESPRATRCSDVKAGESVWWSAGAAFVFVQVRGS